MIEDLKAVLQRELLKTHADLPDMACPKCSCKECIHYEKTRAGTQSGSAAHAALLVATGSILAFTKLDDSVWMEYATCFVDRLTCDRVAERLKVCHKTAWFMRLRTLQAIFKNNPSFEVKAGIGVEIDELYFRESFKGTRFDGMEFQPREPREDGNSSKAGISDEQICVLTAFNDTDDFFFEVCCRGALTNEIALKSLNGKICAGAIVNTDEHKAYPRVMKELSVATHNAINSRGP